MSSKHSSLGKICLGLLVAIAIYLSMAIGSPSLAQANLNLKSDIISLRSRISRLEQEVTRLRSSNSRSLDRTARIEQSRQIPNPTNISPPEVNGQVIGRSDPLYEKFATLLIELKEDVKNLDRRLTEIENKAP